MRLEQPIAGTTWRGVLPDSSVTVVSAQSLDRPAAFILAIVEFHDVTRRTAHDVHRPFRAAPDVAATSVNDGMRELLAMASPPS